MSRDSQEALEAARFYATDVREEMESVDIMKITKADARASQMAWLNSVRLLESLINEATENQ